MRSTNNILPAIERNKGFSKTKSSEDFNFKARFSQNEIPLNGTINSNKISKKSLILRENGPQTQQINQQSSKNFIKDFSNKLEKHQYDIEKRDELIRELELTLDKLRIEFLNEKNSSEEKSRQMKEMGDSYEKLNNRFKTNHIKMEELVTKVQFYEKEIKKMKEDDQKVNLQKTQEEIQSKRIQELEENLKAASLQFQQEDKQKTCQINELTQKLNEQILNNKNLKADFDSKEAKLQKSLGIIQAFEEEKKAVENSIQNLRRSSTLKQQELESKNKESENLAKNFLSLKDENTKLMGQLKDIKSKLDEQLMQKNQQTNEQTELQTSINKQKEQINTLTNDNISLTSQMQDIKLKNTQLEQQITQKNDKLQNMLKELENIRNKQTTNDKSSSDLKQSLNDLKKKNDDSEKTIQTMSGQLQSIQKQSKKLDEAEKEILKSLKCNFCDQFIKEPITIIPCGHSFCFGCKKAYAKDCIKCGPKVKVEAMYRNELLDDIIGMVKIVQSLQTSLKLI